MTPDTCAMCSPCWVCTRPTHEHCAAHGTLVCPGLCECERRAA